MFKKIIVAIDGSEASKKALSVAVDESKAWNAELHAIYVIETGLLSSIPIDNTIEAIYGLLENEGEHIMDFCRTKAEEAGIAFVKHIAQGHAGNEILKAAEKEGVDLIVLGSHGKSEIDQFLLGSVTTYVVRHSKISTMVVRS